MDIAKTLIRSVTRTFYDTKHVLVVDALMIHSVLPNEDLALLLGMQPKDLRKLCGKLKEDRLLAVHSRLEIRDGMSKPINKDYYFVDFHATIDAIKYRVYFLTEKVKELYKPTSEKKDYFCPQCKAQWTQLEVLDKVGPMGFECHRCGGPLEREERKEGDATGHEKQSKLMSQLDGLIRMLQQIDSQEIPNNDFDTAMSLAVPVERDSNMNPLRPYQPTNTRGAPAAVNRVSTTAVALDVSVTTSSERTAAEQAEEARKKADLAAQNVLPVWHTTSTVTGEKTSTANKTGEAHANGTSLVKDEEDVKKEGNVMNDELTAYYAQLAKEKEKEAQEEREADESSGEGEEEFEDVEVGPSSTDTSPNSKPALSNGAKDIKREQSGKTSETEGSTPATNASTPANGEADGPSPKKVKFEEGTAVTTNGKVVGNNLLDKDSDEDDGVEFEDV